MAASLATLPGYADFAVRQTKDGLVLSDGHYAFLKSIVAVIADRDATIAAQAVTIAAQTAHIETLRVALNEVRQNPTTVYPAIPAF